MKHTFVPSVSIVQIDCFPNILIKSNDEDNVINDEVDVIFLIYCSSIERSRRAIIDIHAGLPLQFRL